MRWFNRAPKLEKRDTIKSSSPYLAEFFGLNGTGPLAQVDVTSASGLSVAFACVATISQTLASVPLSLYQKQSDGGREKATGHPLHVALHDIANETMTAFEMREFLVASVLTHGNAFAKINWSKRGQVEGLEPLHPKSVIVEKLQSGRLRYRVTAFKGQAHSYLQNEMLHIRYRLAPDGYMGLSPITVARATFGLALEQQSQATAQASKGFRPEGTLVFPNPIGVDGKADALDALAAKASDTTSKGGILVLDGGVEWHPLSFSSRDAEFLESRKLSDLAIARIFGVPPTSIGVTDHATYSNVFGENQALVSRCLSPMAKRVEQAMCAALLPKESRRTLFIEHDLKGLIRGDIETRYNSYAAARQWGFMTTNEIRALENLPRVEGGDALLSPLNMADQKGTKDGPMESD